MKIKVTTIALLLGGTLQALSQEADSIYYNGSIITVNDAQPEVEAVAVRGGKIMAVGEKAEVMSKKGEETRMVNLGGKAMLPGFVDSHGHTYMIGLQATTANLLPPPDGTGKDIASLQKLLKGWAEGNKEVVEKIGWIAGFGYDDSQLAEQRHPTREDLDKVSTEFPVLIIHQSGHLGVGNSKALELAGINAETKNPKGGVFRRKEGTNEPNGVCEEYAFFMLIGKLAASFDAQINDTLVVEGARLQASFGYTTAQEGRAVGSGLDAMKRVSQAGKLKIDLVAYPDVLEVKNPQPSMDYEKRYRQGGVKLTIDGSPQGKTAWLTEPYFIPPAGQDKSYVGYAAIDEETTMKAVEKAFANGWQILCHSNGDAASDRYIKAVTAAQKKYPKVQNRPVLIHGQVLREDQVESAKQLGVFLSLFPMHTYYWGDYHRDSVLGPERAPNISPTGWVLERGMMFGSHHDAPVALPNSMRILSATVTRKTRSGKVLGPQHKVDVATALKALTIWPAWQHFEEKQKGSIEVGKLADFVVLSENPLKIDEDKLADIHILETIKEDVTVYKKGEGKVSMASPAMFGITPHEHGKTGFLFGTGDAAYDPLLKLDGYPKMKPFCGDGCFNHGLSVMLNAIENADTFRVVQ
ncbi:amidohydrolase [Rubritalea tangerina]|uniref:Amidohydrolase n=1 Tax=Rubritalea tangerina TaxID=430798 RepID=A0ABW4ZG12_9BACT